MYQDDRIDASNTNRMVNNIKKKNLITARRYPPLNTVKA